MIINFLHKYYHTVSTLFVVALAFVAVQFLWLILDSNQIIDNQAAVQAKKITIKQPKVLPLFGQEEKVKAKKAVVQKKINKTKLNLVLKGIWLNQEQSKKSYVLIELSKQDKIFYLNDNIANLAKLIEINTNHIVLNRSGQLEALYLRKNKKIFITAAPKKKSNLVPSLSIKEKQKLNSIRKSLKSNPWRLSEILSIQPKYSQGKLIGFAIRPGKERHLFYKLGFLPGDIVSKINDNRLTLSSLQKVLNLVVNNSDIRITFRRNNQSNTIVLKL